MGCGVVKRHLEMAKPTKKTHLDRWAVVVAQLVDRPLPNTRGPQFESSHRRIFIKKTICLHIVNCVEIIKIKEKEAGIGPFKNYLDR